MATLMAIAQQTLKAHYLEPLLRQWALFMLMPSRQHHTKLVFTGTTLNQTLKRVTLKSFHTL
jgi:hypothetical protein